MKHSKGHFRLKIIEKQIIDKVAHYPNKYLETFIVLLWEKCIFRNCKFYLHLLDSTGKSYSLCDK